MNDRAPKRMDQGFRATGKGDGAGDEAAWAFSRLSSWWRSAARDFPWRFGRTSPWGVLLSEVMSQQTPMSRVLPYWRQWMGLWPTPQDLAQASTGDLIAAWGRLGYPRRALRLKECAQVVSQEFGGRLPDDYQSLVALSGIGDYTASAILSFAYGERVVVLDTNIRRVLVRAFTGQESRGGSTTKGERDLAQSLLPADRAQSVRWNQAVMELGALICTASQPACDRCPLKEKCLFLAVGRPGLGSTRTRPKQSFVGTNRQVRGIIIDALRRAPDHRLGPDQVRSLWKDQGQLDECVIGLDQDGLIVIGQDQSLSLPV